MRPDRKIDKTKCMTENRGGLLRQAWTSLVSESAGLVRGWGIQGPMRWSRSHLCSFLWFERHRKAATPSIRSAEVVMCNAI